MEMSLADIKNRRPCVDRESKVPGSRDEGVSDRTASMNGRRSILSAFAPDEYLSRVMDVDLAKLRESGIKGLILDLDNTLVPRYESETSVELKDWLRRVDDVGLGVCIVSNNFTARVGAIAKELGLRVVKGAGKPLASAFKQGMRVLGTVPAETAVVGDQVFTDVLGGNRLGMHTILVVPLSEKEMLHTRILRKLECRVLHALAKRRMIGSDGG